jgi:hypothetical protein
MKKHLLVFDDGSGTELDVKSFVDSLDEGAEMYELDGHVSFITSGLTASEISDRFTRFAGSRLFFVTDISSAPCSGRLPGSLWDFIKQTKLAEAAE